MNDQQWEAKVRAEFEASHPNHPRGKQGAHYINGYTQSRWEGYLAAKQQDKAAMEDAIEPAIDAACKAYQSIYAGGVNYEAMREGVKAAMRAINIVSGSGCK